MKKEIYIALLLCSLVAGGCFYDVEEDLYGAKTCDVSHVTYSGTVTPILNNNGCFNCHGTPLAGGAPFNLEGYANLTAHKDRLFGAINHSSGFAPMPAGSAKMNQCDINKIKTWLDAGAPQN